MEKKKYYQIIPFKVKESLTNIEAELKDIPGYCTDNLKEIVSIISFHSRKNDDSWTPVNITYMRKIVPRADQYMKKLMTLGIIQRSASYQSGKTAYKYRFSPKYVSEYKAEPLLNAKLRRRIEKHSRILKKHNSKKYPNQNEFIRTMTIDPECLVSINNMSLTIDQYNYAITSTYKIINRDIYYSVDATSGRYHSNLTNLPGYLRPYVRIKGEKLANVDIKNSQPYLSTLLLTNPGKVAHLVKYRKFSMLLESLQVSQTEDIKRYVSLVREGQIYEYLWQECEKRGLHFKSRDVVKKKMLVILFSKNYFMPKYRRIFAELFPMVHRIFNLIRGHEGGNKFISYKRLPILLQRIESYLVLDVILQRINSENPGIIAVTIHDSIMTRISTNDVATVKRIMIEELTKFVGIEPTLKIES